MTEMFAHSDILYSFALFFYLFLTLDSHCQCQDEEIAMITSWAWCKILCKRKSTKSGNGAMKSAQAAG